MSTQFVNIQPLSQPVDLGVEPATFSPAVEAEIDPHLAKYPVTALRDSAVDVHRAARTRLSRSSGRALPR